jgi:RimJ/RimL family protein N-acetyltransferase
VLETARLILRAHDGNDLEAVHAMWSDPEIVRHITGKPSTREESWARILRYAGLWPLKGYGYWAVVEKSSGRFIGDIGIADFAREMMPPIYEAPEAGWALVPAAHGKGYATEAMQAALAWVDATLDVASTMCMLDEKNAASMRVAQKCGYREYARAEYKGSSSLLYRRVK